MDCHSLNLHILYCHRIFQTILLQPIFKCLNNNFILLGILDISIDSFHYFISKKKLKYFNIASKFDFV